MSISEKVDQYLNQEYSGLDSSIFRDLSLNLKKLLEEGPLEPTERFMNLLAIGTTLEDQALMKMAKTQLEELSVPADQIRESAEVAGIMGMNNVYYKFRSYLPEEVRSDYQRAGLRMMSLGKPVTGKQSFEMMAMSVSVVNGCPSCIASHEKSLKDLGVSADRIHELARMAAVCKGLSSLRSARSLFV